MYIYLFTYIFICVYMYDASLMRQTRAQYPGATLGGQAGHYPTPAVKGMS